MFSRLWTRSRRSDPVIPFVDGEIDLTSDVFVRDPYPTYAALRAEYPVAQVAGGGYVLTRHADIVSALRNPALANAPSRYSVLHASKRGKYPAADLASNILPFLDPPKHTDLRRLVAKAFGNTAKPFDSRIISEAQRAVESIHATTLDAVNSLAAPYAAVVMCAFLGIPVTDAAKLRRWSESFFYLFAPVRDAAVFSKVNDDIAEMRRYFLRQISSGAGDTGQGLIDAMRIVEDSGRRLSEQEIADNALLMFADGVENVRYGVGTVLLTLGDIDPQMWGDIRDLKVVRAATAEALRLNTPVQTIPRVATTEVTISDTTIQAGVPVFLALASANRDANVFENPDVFDIARDQSPALTFGAGRHACIGGYLAETQIVALVHALLARGVRVLTSPEQVEYLTRFGHRWPRHVEITLDT